MFYGWRVVAGAFICQMFTIGFFSYSISILTPSIRESFGASLEQVMYSLTAGTLLGMIAMPLSGILADRVPVRAMVCGGLVFFAVGLAALARTESITHYILLFGLTMAVSNSFAGSLTSSTVISRWFTQSRGRALGISATGTSIGGMLVPYLITLGIEHFGWRSTLDTLALVIALTVLPAVFFTFRGRPEDVGLEAEASEQAASGNAQAATPMAIGDLLRDGNFWFLAVSLGLLFSAYSAVLANISPYVTGAGFSGQQASSAIMLLAFSGLVGKLLFGMMADRIDLKVGLWLAQGLALAGCALLAIQPGYTIIMLAATVLGLAAGGMLPVWGALVAQLFGLASYGRAMGGMGPIITLSVLPGYTVTGILFDRTGDYSASLWIFCAVIATSAILLSLIKLPAPAQTEPAPAA